MPPAFRPRQLPWTVLGLTLLPLIMAACSTASSTPNTTDQSNRTTLPASQTACALIAPAEVKSILSTTVGAPHAVVSGSVTTCTYKAADPSKSVIIEYDTAASSATFAADKSQIEQHEHVTTTPIQGLGDQAYAFIVRSSGDAVNTVVSLQGTLQTIVTSTSQPASVEVMAEEILALIDQHNAGTTTTTSKPTG